MKLFALLAQTLDIETKIMCEKEVDKGKELRFDYRLPSGGLRVFDPSGFVIEFEAHAKTLLSLAAQLG